MTVYIPLTYYLNGGAKTVFEQAIEALEAIDTEKVTDVRFFITSSYNNEAIKYLVNWCDIFTDLDLGIVVFKASERFIKNYNKRG